PVVLGGAAGLGIAVAAAGLLGPSGTLDGATLGAAWHHAAGAVPAAFVALAAAAGLSFPRRDPRGSHVRALRRIPPELPVLAAGGAVLAALLAGGGVARAKDGIEHPRLIVFVCPVLLALAAGGLAGRLLPRLVPRPRRVRPAVFLATRELLAARGLLVMLFV